MESVETQNVKTDILKCASSGISQTNAEEMILVTFSIRYLKILRMIKLNLNALAAKMYGMTKNVLCDT